MRFSLQGQRGTPLYVRLRDQLRILILSGALAPGRKLPGVRELAAYLHMNRHTVSRALHELEAECLIHMKQGRGTFVAEDILVARGRDQERFMEVVQRSLNECTSLGFSAEELASAVLCVNADTLVMSPDDLSVLSVGFVECNPISLDRYASDLREKLGVRVQGFLISDLRQRVEAGENPAADCDLVVTTMGHLPEVRRILNEEQEICTISVGPYLEVFFEVLALPKDRIVGIITASELGSVGMEQSMIQAGVAAERLRVGSMERPDSMAQVAEQADALVVSSSAIDVVRPLLPTSPQPLIVYHNVLDSPSIEALRRVLQDISAKRGVRPVGEGNGVSLLGLQRTLEQE